MKLSDQTKHRILCSLAAFTGAAFALGLFLFILTCVTACGQTITVRGGTTHEVQGTATVKLVVDFSICDSLDGDDKASCIRQLLDVLARLEQTDKPGNIEGDK